ncbi:TIGR00296 family protein [Sulfolobus acidocaldarius]|uniref:Protein Saci_0792 n=4 Tax=Sulfolobus acidocaldarius TaxID=2285 RepID=Y792_SULAC|nr:TIGR00296 family protein [Sulfolobus acidocaldarius]Q4JAL7.1 RecName: Full=Protein Saci_0792 [Sulfolobus acidocaldarius DSM 639]AAY80162.1 conserved Archaeal protein [Sulfolobus acidocaldarius DSM 639]AGE70740.1 hypothetical protein SacN8_03840 [Sulfolobus acidocaldarius N8]AGE73012.1 hypothetical protein SacRon12I_03825 [Sulfolobus acidocaldarius Ron12/I]ALU28927.1 hypothetical protein ATY89_02445 [Sulfolobus acidocaldarius]ALU31653.1 hypothetical protein ATZ20_05480 [Sulfolobus acidocald
MSLEQLVTINDLNVDIGKQLIKIARDSIKNRFKLVNLNLDEYKNPVLNKRGLAFVTIEKIEDERTSLRGCIGYVEAVAPLKEIVSKAAVAAAFSDPRFPPLSKSELNDILIEVTILTKPEEISVKDRWKLPSFINVGEDGLIVEYGIMYSGLLLPQVASEYCWDSETFLAETCIKAGLKPDCWLNERVKIKKFNGLIYREINKNTDEIIVLRPSDIKCKKSQHSNLQ